jgi:hypothetical protein
MLRLASVIAVVTLTVAGSYGASAQTSTKSAENPVTFTKDVLPILQQSCQSCHRPGQVGPMPLLTYEQVRPWARAIRTQIVARTMPPWHADRRYGHFENDRSLKQTEIDTIVTWIDLGAPQGNPQDAPAPVAWPPAGWQIQPDVVVTLPPYEVAANATIEWENLAVPSPFTEDTWVTSIEILPSDHSTVHHLCFGFQPHRDDIVYNRYEWAEIPRDEYGAAVKSRPDPAASSGQAQSLQSPKETWVLTRDAGSREVIRKPGKPSIMAGGGTCYVPGMAVHDYRPYGAAILVRGGSDLLLNLHYQTVGKPVTNTVRMGFTVAKAPPKKKIVMLAGATRNLAIPPNEPDYVTAPAEFKLMKDVELIWFSPHMHVRGKEMTWSAKYPDGRNEILLRVAPYQYNWQIQYHTRLPIPAGTSISVVARFDNSSRNKANPNPNVWVYEGNQAWEEMMGGGTWFVVDADVNERELTARPARPVPGV